MKRRDFIRLATSGLLGATGFGLAGCEEYPTRTVYGVDVYFFYWDSNVYYYPYSRIYIYIIDGRWIRSSRPPPYFVSDPRLRVRIISRDGMPYARNEEHRRMYSKPVTARDTRPKPVEQPSGPAPRNTSPVKQQVSETRKPDPRQKQDATVKPRVQKPTVGPEQTRTSPPRSQAPVTQKPDRKSTPSAPVKPATQMPKAQQQQIKRDDDEEDRNRKREN